MKKFTLALAAMLGLSVLSAQATDPCTLGTQVTNDNVETAFADGAVVVLQCLDVNGGSYYYFNGAEVKSEELGATNLFKVVRQEAEGTFVFQSLADNTYVGPFGAGANTLVTAEDEIDNAMKIQSAEIASAGGWTTIADGVVNGTNTVRFTATNGQLLNTNNKDLLPKWFTGTGGYSVWYAFVLTDAEVAEFIPGYGAGSEPGEVVMDPAVTALKNGGTYYIYDSYNGANGDRVGFWGDVNCSNPNSGEYGNWIAGPHETAEEAYRATNLDDATEVSGHNIQSLATANYVWKAIQDETGSWAFQNMGTGKYIGNSNTPSDTPEYCTMEVFPDGDGPDYFKVTGLSSGKQFDANCGTEICILSWWQGSGHPMQFYQAVEDGDDTYKFAATDPSATYTVTVNFVCGEEIVATFSKSGKPGVPYSFKAPQFYATETGEPVAGEIGSKNETINVPVTENLPFHASAAVEGAEYQAVMIQSSYYNTANPFTFAYDDDEEELGAPRTNKTSIDPYTANQMFAFIGSLKEGFKIYSKVAEQYLVYGDVATLATEEEGTLFELRASSSNTGAQFFTLYNAAAGQYLNFNAGNETISHWSAADNGSTMWVAGISQPVINYYADFFTQAAELAGDDPEVTAAIEYAQGYLATLNAYDELTAEDLAPVVEIKEMLEMMVQVVSKKNDLKKYYDASYLGAEAYEADTELLYVATSVEELETAYQTLLGDAKEYFINSFVQGAYLKNKRAGKYMGYTSAEDPDDDEIIITQYSKFVEPTIDCYFTLEATEEGYKLYNPASKTYLGIQPDNDTVPAVTEESQIALYEVVAGSNGFEFLCINSDVENNYINTDSYSGPLVIWNYANDGGAFWIAENLPLFDEFLPVEMNAEGTVENDLNVSLNTISVVVDGECQPTDFAVISVVNAAGQTVATATIAEGNETGVYDITLAEPVKAEGVYTIILPKAAFTFEELYSPYTTISYTIGAAQDSISEITIAEGNNTIYDLQGRRVIAPARGLYIINGQKVVK